MKNSCFFLRFFSEKREKMIFCNCLILFYLYLFFSENRNKIDQNKEADSSLHFPLFFSCACMSLILHNFSDYPNILE